MSKVDEVLGCLFGQNPTVDEIVAVRNFLDGYLRDVNPLLATQEFQQGLQQGIELALALREIEKARSDLVDSFNEVFQAVSHTVGLREKVRVKTLRDFLGQWEKPPAPKWRKRI